MGGDADPKYVSQLAQYLHREHPQLKVAWYSGRQQFPRTIRKRDFDYIKLGPYIEHLGCLKERTTNQRLYKRAAGAYKMLIDSVASSGSARQATTSPTSPHASGRNKHALVLPQFTRML
mgnify:CR=1 FL=1